METMMGEAASLAHQQQPRVEADATAVAAVSAASGAVAEGEGPTSGELSRRQRRKRMRQQRKEARKQRRREGRGPPSERATRLRQSLENAEYKTTEEVDDFGVRRLRTEVVPYVHQFRTTTKARWIGQTLQSVFSSEFIAFDQAYLDEAFRRNMIFVQGRPAGPDTVLGHGDVVTHWVHRHEPPVFGTVQVVGESDGIVALNKPASLPCHPCGAYHRNSVLGHLTRLRPDLHTSLCHRLDRLTSGLLILGKDTKSAIDVGQLLSSRGAHKMYLARVRGHFPDNAPRSLAQIQQRTPTFQRPAEFEDGAVHDATSAELGPNLRPLDPDSGDNDNACENESENENENDSDNNEVVDVAEGLQTKSPIASSETRAPPKKKRKKKRQNEHETGPYLEEELGYFVLSEADVRGNGSGENANSSSSSSSEGGEETKKGTAADDDDGEDEWGERAGDVVVRYPTRCVSYKFSVYECANTDDSKWSETRFRVRSRTEHTTLVECYPRTGRTHQLRMHLRLLGHSIVNDPHYQPVATRPDLDDEARQERLANAATETGEDVVSEQQTATSTTSSASAAVTAVAAASATTTTTSTTTTTTTTTTTSAVAAATTTVDSASAKSAVAAGGASLSSSPNTGHSNAPHEQDIDPEEMARKAEEICLFCTGRRVLGRRLGFEDVEDEPTHHREIWLHSTRFQAGDVSFAAPPPDWALPSFREDMYECSQSLTAADVLRTPEMPVGRYAAAQTAQDHEAVTEPR